MISWLLSKRVKCDSCGKKFLIDRKHNSPGYRTCSVGCALNLHTQMSYSQNLQSK